jgi:hypothetical protein
MSKRLQDLTTLLKSGAKSSGNTPRARLKIGETRKFWLGFAFLCLLTTFLINNPFWRASAEQIYQEGDIARESIISPADISTTDTEETERIKQSAREPSNRFSRLNRIAPTKPCRAFVRRGKICSEKTKTANAKRAKLIQTRATRKNPTRSGRARAARKSAKFSRRGASANELDSVTRVLRETATVRFTAIRIGSFSPRKSRCTTGRNRISSQSCKCRKAV